MSRGVRSCAVAVAERIVGGAVCLHCLFCFLCGCRV